mgnify:CR=1 FL=1
MGVERDQQRSAPYFPFHTYLPYVWSKRFCTDLLRRFRLDEFAAEEQLSFTCRFRRSSELNDTLQCWQQCTQFDTDGDVAFLSVHTTASTPLIYPWVGTAAGFSSSVSSSMPCWTSLYNVQLSMVEVRSMEWRPTWQYVLPMYVSARVMAYVWFTPTVTLTQTNKL